MKTILFLLGSLSIIACSTNAPEDETTLGAESAELQANKCNSFTLGRNVNKFECVQDAQCNWNQCVGGNSWGGFSNDVCAPLKPWQNPACSQTFAHEGCPFLVPAVGDDGTPGTCDSTNPPPPAATGAVCTSALNPNATIKAFDCFEHGDGDDWWQCREDGEWIKATLEPSGKVFGPLQAPTMPVPGCLTTHRR